MTDHVRIQTYTGMRFHPLDPEPSSIRIPDIAHALANVCRFGGHCRVPHSVAEHSVRVSLRAEAISDPTRRARMALAGLMHDAGEAYIGDLAKPLRVTPMGVLYGAMERGILAAVEERFHMEGLLVDKPFEVAIADRELLSTERRDLMAVVPWEWEDLPPPLPEKIVPWGHEEAERRFLARWKELTT